MVRFRAAPGNADAQLVAREKHYVLFDRAQDKGALCKAAYLSLGWVPDIEGCPALPYSVTVGVDHVMERLVAGIVV